jgi:NAD(P)-dependent dehydrogenase (short-subunit alcohol dehydrogenase family)
VADRIAFITGCSSGIGLGVAQRLLDRGWRVIAGLRDPARAPRELTGATLVALDVSRQQQILDAVAGIERLDCLINNAGYGLTGPFASYTAAQMERQVQVNLLGPALLTQQLLPALKRARGRILTVSSLCGEAGMPMMTMYCATKYALEGWAEALRYELAADGVQVGLIEPGGFRTRFGENMEWGARALASDSSEAAQLAAYRAMRDRLLAGHGVGPAPVVEAIVRLTEASQVPIRTRVGTDALVLRAIKRLLPERLAIGLIGTAFRRRLAAAAKP